MPKYTRFHHFLPDFKVHIIIWFYVYMEMFSMIVLSIFRTLVHWIDIEHLPFYEAPDDFTHSSDSRNRRFHRANLH